MPAALAPELSRAAPPGRAPLTEAEEKALRRRSSLRRLLALARPEAKNLVLGTIFLALGSVAGLGYPQAIRYLLDDALADPTGRSIDRAALAMMGVLAVQSIAVAVRFTLFSTAGERVVQNLRRDLYRAIVSQDIAFFDERKTGELTNRLAADTTVLQSAVSVNVSMALRNGANVIGGIALLFYTSPPLTLVMLLVVPPIALGAVLYGRRLRSLSREVQDSLAHANEVAEESLAGIRTVRAFAAEPREVGRYAAAIAKSFELARTRIRMAAGFMSFASFLSFVAASLVLWYGGHLVLEHRLEVGALTAFLIYTLIVAFALGALTDLYADFTKALGAGERIFELLDRAPAMSRQGETLPVLRGELALDHVGFAYPARPDVTVLDDLSLHVSPGEVVALVGPSGAGKSTLASLVTRLYDPLRGRVTIDGHDARSLDADWLRQNVGIVSQEPILFSTTIAENIRYGRVEATDAEVEAAARAAYADSFVRSFPDGYATSVGERGVQLSGGQKQRIAIARALLKDPKILVLDEATSALDAESEHLVQQALDRLMENRTTLVIAHRLSTVRAADRVVVLEAGRVVESGTHDSLMAEEGLYRKLVERQLRSLDREVA